MSYYCPKCGALAKRKEGATDQKEGRPVICPEHGRVFVNPNKLPILSFLTRPFTSKDRIKRAQKAIHQRAYREKNPEVSKQRVLDWRSKNPDWSQRSNKKRWEKLSKDPLALEERNRKRREWRVKHKEAINQRKREAYKKEAACQE